MYTYIYIYISFYLFICINRLASAIRGAGDGAAQQRLALRVRGGDLLINRLSILYHVLYDILVIQ